jgi:hypothetical protein
MLQLRRECKLYLVVWSIQLIKLGTSLPGLPIRDHNRACLLPLQEGKIITFCLIFSSLTFFSPVTSNPSAPSKFASTRLHWGPINRTRIRDDDSTFPKYHAYTHIPDTWKMSVADNNSVDVEDLRWNERNTHGLLCTTVLLELLHAFSFLNISWLSKNFPLIGVWFCCSFTPPCDFLEWWSWYRQFLHAISADIKSYFICIWLEKDERLRGRTVTRMIDATPLYSSYFGR